MNARVCAGALSGEVKIPASKSEAHRAIICAALSGTPTQVCFDETCDDIEATLACVRALGCRVSGTDNGRLIESGAEGASELDCGESGSTLRFLLPVAAALGKDVCFVMSGRLPERPVDELLCQLEEHGARFARPERSRLECSGQLTGGRYVLSANVSSQFVSGLLFALPMLGADSEIEITGELQSAGYVEMTIRTLKMFGIRVYHEGRIYRVPGGQKYISPGSCVVGGDWSGAAFWMCAAAICKGRIICRGLETDSTQGDRAIAGYLERMGAQIVYSRDGIEVTGGELEAIEADLSETPDIAPILACTAACANGRSVFTGVARLRIKESDRLEATAKMLRLFGAEVSVGEDRLEIIGGAQLKGAHINGCNDHRMVMSAAVLACVCGDTVISDAQAVGKSYPTFFEHFSQLGGVAKMLDLDTLRREINAVDEQLAKLVEQRMDISSEVARYKLEHGIPVLDSAREEQVIERMRASVREDIRDDIEQLYRLMMKLSRERQHRLMEEQQ